MGPILFHNTAICHAGVLLCLDSLAQFFTFSCYNDVICILNSFVNLGEFVIKTFDSRDGNVLC